MYLWNGGSLLIGRSTGATGVHSHHAIQIALSADLPIRFRLDPGSWRDYDGVLITPNLRHAFDGASQTVAHVFVEPESREGRAILERLDTTGIVPMDNADLGTARAFIFQPWASRANAATMIRAAHDVIRHFSGGLEPRQPVDDRVASAVAYMKANIDRPLSLSDIASAVNLSPGRFRHLFVAETGMTVRPYILWLRFQRAWELIAAGNSLSAAAHGAGFADAAHLTRTSRRMFGAPPVAIRLEDLGQA
jgi:AraC-like DNA-binding protein